jgi:predicted transposase YbfD/YdcC
MSDICLAHHFAHLDDPRRDQGKRHSLQHILVIALCAVVAGAEGWDDIATFARAKADWLGPRLGLKHGTPSGDTFRRVFSSICPEAFARGFISWVEAVARETAGEVIAIDGKTLRRSYEKDDPKAALHMISAWACQQRLVLAQERVAQKSNEITAIPALLETLALKGCIVTLDAMGTQTKIAEKIRAKGADYVLALKSNQETLYREVRAYFEEGAKRQWRGMPVGHAQTVDLGHGRKEVRRVWVSSDVEWVPKFEAWRDLGSIVMIEYERHTQQGVSLERRFYISSLQGVAPERMLSIIRSHWGIENRLHWVLDVVFREDESRIRRGNGAQNMAVLRHLALNLLRKDKTKRLSLRMKRKRAGWDDAFLAHLVGM